MQRRAPLPCLLRPVLRLENQTLRPPPSSAPLAARGTRSPAVGHLPPAWNSASTAPPWRTNPASSPTTKAAETVAETASPAAAPAATKLGSGSPTAIVLLSMEIQAMGSRPIHNTLCHPPPEPGAAPHRDTVSSFPNRATLQVDSTPLTARVPPVNLHMSRAALPAPAAIILIIIIPKKMLR